MTERIVPKPSIGIRNIAFNINTEKITLDSAVCQIVGNVCTLNVRLVAKTNIINADNILYNLPKATKIIKFAINKSNGNNIAGLISTSGNCNNDWATINANEDFFINVTYLTND